MNRTATETAIESELGYLLYLLEDEDQEVYQNIHNKLVFYGPSILSYLEDSYEKSILNDNEFLEERLLRVLEKINYDVVSQEFRKWMKSEDKDLLQAMILIAKYQYRDLNEDWIRKNIEEMVNSIDFEISRYNPPLQSVSIINRFLYDTYEFRPVRNPENIDKHFAINHVLSAKKGVPASIGILYLIIASKLDIPILGIVIEDNLLLGYFKRHGGWKKRIPKLHFYINPTDKGSIFTSNTLIEHLHEWKVPFCPSFNKPTCHLQIFKLVLSHLIENYRKTGQNLKMLEMDAWVIEIEKHHS